MRQHNPRKLRQPRAKLQNYTPSSKAKVCTCSEAYTGLVHDYRLLVDPLLRFKRVDYEYDLYSGKVLLLSYNRGHVDQFYQRYRYDEDHRLLEVMSSRDGIYWDRDAGYSYYDHGPLARLEIGEHRVQGVDYAYTLQGWLKAINGVENRSEADIGGDGALGGAMP